MLGELASSLSVSDFNAHQCDSRGDVRACPQTQLRVRLCHFRLFHDDGVSNSEGQIFRVHGFLLSC